MAMLLGEHHRGKSLLIFLQQPGWACPLCQCRVTEGPHGSPSSRETCLTLRALPRNKGPGGGGGKAEKGGRKLCITTN